MVVRIEVQGKKADVRTAADENTLHLTHCVEEEEVGRVMTHTNTHSPSHTSAQSHMLRRTRKPIQTHTFEWHTRRVLGAHARNKLGVSVVPSRWWRWWGERREIMCGKNAIERVIQI
jgi:hypothetical protein